MGTGGLGLHGVCAAKHAVEEHKPVPACATTLHLLMEERLALAVHLHPKLATLKAVQLPTLVSFTSYTNIIFSSIFVDINSDYVFIPLQVWCSSEECNLMRDTFTPQIQSQKHTGLFVMITLTQML